MTVVMRLAHLIDGGLAEPDSARLAADLDPATGEVLAEMPEGDETDVDRAVAAAKKAFPIWSGLPGNGRKGILWSIHGLMKR